MAEYIEREAAIKVIRDYGKGAISDGMTALDPVDDIVALAQAMEWLPAEDVAPVVHAQWLDAPWIYYGAKQYVCSRCQDDDYWRKRELHFKEPYCPNCGAKMTEAMGEWLKEE